MALHDPVVMADDTDDAVARLLASGMFDAALFARDTGGTGRPDDLARDYIAEPALHDAAVSPWFDAAWYRASAAPFRGAALLHYLDVGRGLGLSPHPLFCPRFYGDAYGPLDDLADDPYAHYRTRGWRRGWRPHALFNPLWYALQTELAGETLGEEPPLLHYLRQGGPGGLSASPYFSPSAYRALHPGVGAAEDPLLHYLRHGGRPGWDPHGLFDTAFAGHRHGTPTPAGTALADYILRTARAGASPHPDFDIDAYRRVHGESMLSDDPLLDLILTSEAEPRFASADGATAEGLAATARRLHPGRAAAGAGGDPQGGAVLHIRSERRDDLRRPIAAIGAGLAAAGRRSIALVAAPTGAVALDMGAERITFGTDEAGQEALIGLLHRLDVRLVHVHGAIDPTSPLGALPERLGVPFCVGLDDDARGQDDWLAAAARLFAPSPTVAERLAQRTGLAVTVRPPVSQREAVVSAVPSPDGRLIRIACLDALDSRGATVRLTACAGDALARDLPLEFVVVGMADPSSFGDAPQVRVATAASSLADLLRTEPCHAALFLDTAPVLFSTVLAETLAAGLFPVAPDAGAMAQQIREAGWGHLIARGLPPAAINDVLADLPRLRTPPPRGLVVGRPYADMGADYYGSDLLRPVPRVAAAHG